MMELKPEKVFYYFEEISKIPRGSGNTREISDYCVAFAKKRNLEVYQDAWNNVIIRKQSSAGRENERGIIIQGHLDMVTEKVPGSKHDFYKDPIELMVEGEYLTAKDTTLGADDGIAVAIALAILDDEELSHPQLEVIFTTDEETGMDGAMNIDLSCITGSYVLNLDSEDEGIFTAGCAGGAKVHTVIPLSGIKKQGTVFSLTVRGLKGGHSGVEIDKERANANILMGRILGDFLGSYGEIGIISVTGGGKDNAIPRMCVTRFVGEHQKAEAYAGKIKDLEKVIREEYATSDPDISFLLSIEGEGSEEVLDRKSTEKLLMYLNFVPNGIRAMSQDIPGLVETSANLGIFDLNQTRLESCTSVRSSVHSRKQHLISQLSMLAGYLGGEVTVTGDYPEWSFKKQSRLREKMTELYRDMFQEEPKINVIHAGLECGYLLQKNPKLDIISFGPQMYDIHTSEEKLSIPSTEKIYRFVRALIEQG
ncbi:MAG: aminoacyl-histidine dipeptidase [Lachnospiraceae bacterium]|nr:aminoacyl-histidine dipeptidase [Lachnospiraceae bacterium]